jgi:hypothetical protein
MDIEYNKLDDEWIKSFENNDRLYQEFYKDDLYYINLRVIYINRNNEIEKIKNQSFLLKNPNKILQEELIGILKNNSIDNENKYRLLSILKYNINLEPEDIKSYLIKIDNEDYLSIIKNIDTITFDKSINMFHDLNDLILIFYERSNELIKKDMKNTTKKIYIRSLNNNKKTIKKRYKD